MVVGEFRRIAVAAVVAWLTLMNVSIPRLERTDASRVLVFGDVLDDIIVAPGGRPAVGTDTEARIQHRAGGSAANTAAWLGAQGARVDFVGRVGVSDVQRHSQLLMNAGVTPRLGYATDDHTGTVVVTLEGSTRSMLTDRGASAGLELDEITSELLEGVAVVHFTGYSFVHNRTPVAFRRLIRRIRTAGALVSIDPASSGFIERFGAEAFLDLVDGADLFLPNLDEARLLTGVSDPEDAVRALQARFGAVAMILPDGSAVAVKQGGKIVSTTSMVTRKVDSVGVGDAFNAGFLCSWLHSSSVAVSSRKGTKLAALSFAVVGGRPSR